MKSITCLAFIAIPLLMGSEAYVWIDKNGVPNYTQQAPPAGIKSERIRFREGGPSIRVEEPASTASGTESGPTSGTVSGTASGTPSADPAASNQNLSPEQQSMLDNLKKAEDARQVEVTKIREANCVKAREVLERLSVTGRIRIRDESGAERALPEDERQTRIDEAQRAIVTNCSTQAG